MCRSGAESVRLGRGGQGRGAAVTEAGDEEGGGGLDLGNRVGERIEGEGLGEPEGGGFELAGGQNGVEIVGVVVVASGRMWRW